LTFDPRARADAAALRVPRSSRGRAHFHAATAAAGGHFSFKMALAELLRANQKVWVAQSRN
jgi:hypothetical protein